MRGFLFFFFLTDEVTKSWQDRLIFLLNMTYDGKGIFIDKGFTNTDNDLGVKTAFMYLVTFLCAKMNQDLGVIATMQLHV